MTASDLPALMPLIILTTGCVLCLLAGAASVGWFEAYKLLRRGPQRPGP